ncbi:MauE/DoxX family redox-associated membrane protein [Chitinophaga deserti]|uniref:MauE/DoxX family redox-associated membrane protein n=1 Tax=Chitinophaga deserti TaxID=2164099 RepID=UPI000D6CDC0E|nr:MauE/DoxX family redox-associated membrane protein [Chitinophaga deserti]
MTQQHEHLPANHAPAAWKPIIIESFVAILLIVLLYTGISKLIDRLSFEINLQQHSIFSEHARLVSYAAPVLEIVIAIALIFNKTRQAGLAASAVLMAFFTGYVVYMMITLPHLPCSCGGAVAWLSWPQHIAFNALLTVIAGITFALNRKVKTS